MKRLTLSVVVLLVASSIPAFAEWRADFGVDVPVNLGAAVTDLAGNTTTANVDVLSNFVFLVPEGSLLYQVPVGPANFGFGIRAFTLVLETLVFPNLLAELNVGPVALDLNLGGTTFLFFGVYNHLSVTSVFIPDLSAYFKLGKVFRLGLGGTLFYDAELYNTTKTIPWMIYLAARFSLKF
ncbi:MAG TPA: hypothetical protein VMW87_13765 [Spirochaetia bacterium]|nr:hypothetical protein [Spirochaetia bacterium]